MTTTQIAASTVAVGQYTTGYHTALLPDNTLVLVYQAGTDTTWGTSATGILVLQCANWQSSNPTWYYVTQAFTSTSERVAIWFDSTSHRLHMVASSNAVAGASLSYFSGVYAQSNGFWGWTWDTAPVTIGSITTGSLASIASDPAGNIYISYRNDASGTTSLQLVSYNGSSWGTPFQMSLTTNTSASINYMGTFTRVGTSTVLAVYENNKDVSVAVHPDSNVVTSGGWSTLSTGATTTGYPGLSYGTVAVYGQNSTTGWVSFSASGGTTGLFVRSFTIATSGSSGAMTATVTWQGSGSTRLDTSTNASAGQWTSFNGTLYIFYWTGTGSSSDINYCGYNIGTSTWGSPINLTNSPTQLNSQPVVARQGFSNVTGIPVIYSSGTATDQPIVQQLVSFSHDAFMRVNLRAFPSTIPQASTRFRLVVGVTTLFAALRFVLNASTTSMQNALFRLVLVNRRTHNWLFRFSLAGNTLQRVALRFVLQYMTTTIQKNAIARLLLRALGTGTNVTFRLVLNGRRTHGWPIRFILWSQAQQKFAMFRLRLGNVPLQKFAALRFVLQQASTPSTFFSTRLRILSLNTGLNTTLRFLLRPFVGQKTANAQNPYGGSYDPGSGSVFPIEQTNLLSTLTQAGAGWVRYQIEWNTLEVAVQGQTPQQGDNPVTAPSRVQYQWSNLDDYITQANLAGLSVVFVLQNPPTWHQSNINSIASVLFITPADAAFFLNELTTRYNGSGANGAPAYLFDAIELGNEGYDDHKALNADDGQLVAQLLQACYQTIKNNSQGRTLVGAGAMLQPHGNQAASHFTQWMNDFYGDNIVGNGTVNGALYCDYLTLHFFNDTTTLGSGTPPTVTYQYADPDINLTGQQAGLQGGANFVQCLAAIAQSQQAHNDAGRPLWVTATGYTYYGVNSVTSGGTTYQVTYGVPDATYATYVTHILTDAMKSGTVQRVFWYNPGTFAPGMGSSQNFSTLTYQAFANQIALYPTWQFTQKSQNAAMRFILLIGAGVQSTTNSVNAAMRFLLQAGANDTRFFSFRFILYPPATQGQTQGLSPLGPTLPSPFSPGLLSTIPALPPVNFPGIAVNGLPLPVQDTPVVYTTPGTLANMILAGTTFSFSISNPSQNALTLLTGNGTNTVSLQYFTYDGLTITLPVMLTTEIDLTNMLQVQAMVMQNTPVTRWVIPFQFF